MSGLYHAFFFSCMYLPVFHVSIILVHFIMWFISRNCYEGKGQNDESWGVFTGISAVESPGPQ